jgi:DNA-nicking Smr family endonuclease
MTRSPERPSRRAPSRPSADEIDLFRKTLRDVKPIKRASPLPSPARASIPGRESVGAGFKPAPTPERKERPRSVGRIPPPPPPPNPGIDRRTAERLRKGAIPIERQLDLHGLTEAAAHAALDRFVRGSWQDGLRMLLIITGKGRGEGVLRSGVPRWLAAGEHAARVLRVSPARPQHGGSGALYVLLRRRRAP